MKFVSKELAIKLKEKCFDRSCFGYYQEDVFNLNLTSIHLPFGGNVTDTMALHQGENDIVDAPIIEQVLEWLREEKDIHIKSDICFRYTSEHKKDKNGTYSGYMNVSKPFWSFLIRKIKNGNCVYDNTTASNNEYLSYEDACIAGIEYTVEHLI